MREQAAALSTEEIIRTLRLYAQAERQIRSGSPLHLPLELALVESVLDSEEQRGDAVPTCSVQQLADQAQGEPSAMSKPEPTPVTEEAALPPAAAAIEGEMGLQQVQTVWPDILREVRIRSVSAEALLKACAPVGVEDGRVILGFRYPFHRDKVEEQGNRALIEDVVRSVLTGARSIHCVLGTEPAAEAPPSAQGNSPFAGDPKAASDSGAEPHEEEEGSGLAAVADDPVVQAMVSKYGAKVVNVQQ
jgi:hypothetical protein